VSQSSGKGKTIRERLEIGQENIWLGQEICGGEWLILFLARLEEYSFPKDEPAQRKSDNLAQVSSENECELPGGRSNLLDGKAGWLLDKLGSIALFELGIILLEKYN